MTDHSSVLKTQQALVTYNLKYWGEGYFDISPEGHLLVKPHGSNSDAEDHASKNTGAQTNRSAIDVPSLVKTIQAKGLSLPILVRFPAILADRVKRIREAFQQSMAKHGYLNDYQLLYPIKVNQQRPVVEAIIQGQLASGQNIGLEAGSKPELIAVLSLAQGHQATIVCNGYKDSHFIRLALLGEKLGHKVFLVVEKPSEVQKILLEAKRLGVKPRLGVRARLASIGKGNWQNTGGEKSKFGLNAYQLLDMIEALKAADALDTLQMLHFHLGSQIASIQDIQQGLRECGRFYVELCQLGAPIATVDVGGGLGVDYEGTGSRSACSMNYDLNEYASAVVSAFAKAAKDAQLPQPKLMSESGRAVTAHHAILLANIIDAEWHPQDSEIPSIPAEAPDTVLQLQQVLEQLKAPIDLGLERLLMEAYHKILSAYQDAQSEFTFDGFSLASRALVERLYGAACYALSKKLNPSIRRHREVLDALNEKLADKLFVNFSLFQSLPDVWGIDQIFPILPISHLDKPATRRVVIQDITCDSDGRVDQYVDGEGIETTLPLPAEARNESLVLAFCMVGAYQEILGDMHNLFGDSDSVDVRMLDDGQIQLSNEIAGDTVASVLKYVNYDVEQLKGAFDAQRGGSALTDADRQTFVAELQESFAAYTYLGD
jgi:arginine decarboxylase